MDSKSPRNSSFGNGSESTMTSQKVLELTGRSFMFLRSIYNDAFSSFFCREMLIVQLNYLYLWFYDVFKDFPSDSYTCIDDLNWDNLQKLGVEELFGLFLKFISRLESIQTKSLSTLDTMLYHAFRNERMDTADKKIETSSEISTPEGKGLDEALRNGYSLKSKEMMYNNDHRLRFFNCILSEFPEHEKIREMVKASLKTCIIKGMSDVIDSHPELNPRYTREKNTGQSSRPISLYNCLHTMTYIDEFGNMYKVFSQIDKTSVPINVSIFDYIDLWNISIDQKGSKKGLLVKPTLQKETSSIEFLQKRIQPETRPVRLMRHPNTITYSDEQGKKYTVFSRWENGSPLVDSELNMIYLLQSPQDVREENKVPNTIHETHKVVHTNPEVHKNRLDSPRNEIDSVSTTPGDISIDIADVESTALNLNFEGSHSNAKSMGILSKQVRLKRSLRSVGSSSKDVCMSFVRSKSRRIICEESEGTFFKSGRSKDKIPTQNYTKSSSKENGIHLYLRADIATYSDGHGNIYKISRQLDTGYIAADDERLNTIALWESMLPHMTKFDANTTTNPYQGVCIFKCPSTWTYVDKFGNIYTIFKHINDQPK